LAVLCREGCYSKDAPCIKHIASWPRNLSHHALCPIFEGVMQKRSLVRIAVVAGSALLIIHLLLFYGFFIHPNILAEKPGKQLNISQDMSFEALKETLQQHGYVSNLASFSFLARLVRYDRKIIPGAYQLETNMSTWQAIQVLKAGTQKPVKIVLHHVRTKEELIAKITQNIEIRAVDFKKLLDDPAFVSHYGFNLDNVMAMFIPNTYEVYWTITAEGLFARMYKEYQQFWNTSRRSKAEYLKLTPIDIAILASIVQSETNKAEEAPLIAGVYINRLRKKIALQSCPTLLHILGDPSARRVLYKYKALDSPYNTYKYRGLPPGPISLPTIAMIDAVLNSRASDYLYFSAKEDFSGYHYFAQSYQEHLRNARRYQKVLNQARIYR
jgi:UPF0755 protein